MLLLHCSSEMENKLYIVIMTVEVNNGTNFSVRHRRCIGISLVGEIGVVPKKNQLQVSPTSLVRVRNWRQKTKHCFTFTLLCFSVVTGFLETSLGLQTRLRFLNLYMFKEMSNSIPTAININNHLTNRCAYV